MVAQEFLTFSRQFIILDMREVIPLLLSEVGALDESLENLLGFVLTLVLGRGENVKWSRWPDFAQILIENRSSRICIRTGHNSKITGPRRS